MGLQQLLLHKHCEACSSFGAGCLLGLSVPGPQLSGRGWTGRNSLCYGTWSTIRLFISVISVIFLLLSFLCFVVSWGCSSVCLCDGRNNLDYALRKHDFWRTFIIWSVVFSFCPLVLEVVLCTSDNDVPCHPSTIPLMGGVYCLSRLRSQAGDHLRWTRRHDVSGFEDVQTAQSSKGGLGRFRPHPNYLSMTEFIRWLWNVYLFVFLILVRFCSGYIP